MVLIERATLEVSASFFHAQKRRFYCCSVSFIHSSSALKDPVENEDDVINFEDEAKTINLKLKP